MLFFPGALGQVEFTAYRDESGAYVSADKASSRPCLPERVPEEEVGSPTLSLAHSLARSLTPALVHPGEPPEARGIERMVAPAIQLGMCLLGSCAVLVCVSVELCRASLRAKRSRAPVIGLGVKLLAATLPL